MYADDSAQGGNGSATGFAELAEDAGSTNENTKDKEYGMLQSRPGATPEEAALYELK